MPAIERHGLGFLASATWDPGRESFGILAEIWGTLYSSVLSLIIAGFFGVGVAIFLTQDFLDARLARVFRTVIEMLAAIPSVVYGLWGIYVVIPALRPVAEFLHGHFGWFPLFSTSLAGPGMAPAVIVLAIMVLPTVAAISQDAFSLIPYKVKEAAYGMGTTKWEAILKVMLPTATSGIFASLVLGFGRALGETMALAMLIGNSNQISWSLFSPANTLASLLGVAVPRGERPRGRGADVRGDRAPADLAGGERRRNADHGVLGPAEGDVSMTATDLAPGRRCRICAIRSATGGRCATSC